MSNKDIETNINENTEKSETPKKKNIVHVFRPQNTQNGGNEEDPAETVRIPDGKTDCRQITAIPPSWRCNEHSNRRGTGSKENREAGSRKSTGQTSGKKRKTGQK